MILYSQKSDIVAVKMLRYFWFDLRNFRDDMQHSASHP